MFTYSLSSNTELGFFFFFSIFIYLATLGLSCGVRALQFLHVASSSLTRDQTQAPCTGSAQSQPLDHEGSPQAQFFFLIDLLLFSGFVFLFFFALCSSIWPYSHKVENVISSILHFTDEEREALGLKRLVRDHSGNTYLHILQNLPPRSVESKAQAVEHLQE